MHNVGGGDDSVQADQVADTSDLEDWAEHQHQVRGQADQGGHAGQGGQADQGGHADQGGLQGEQPQGVVQDQLAGDAQEHG